jgi:aryl-phospho-beta-D-glucosidase BglC (GH1 family)
MKTISSVSEFCMRHIICQCMKILLTLFLLYSSGFSQKLKVASVGNSITYGYGLQNPSSQSFSKELDVTLLPAAREVAGKMKVGWNMGNTLEAICGETAWGGAYTTQKLIDSVKSSGFNAVRLPCSWFCHSDTITSEIDTAWIARVKQVVDYCINDSLYVIINIHWDRGWLENRVDVADSSIVNKRQQAYWTQIANYFKDYNEHLLFASANEPNVNDANGMSVLLSYHQTFINAVRATGGNNYSRTLIIQGPSTDIDKTNNLMNKMPTDQIADRLVVEVHYYTPYQFTLMNEDASWGKIFYYWGKGHHSSTDVTRNATWGEESDVEKYFDLMKTKFVDRGIPVIIGEFGAYKRKLSLPSDQALNNSSVEYYNGYVVKSAINHGMVPFYWDINIGLFDRNKGFILDHEVLDSIMHGAGIVGAAGITGGKKLGTSNEFRLEQNFPNPFNPSTSIDYKLASNSFVVLKVFDTLGRKAETLVKKYSDTRNHYVQFNSSSLPNRLYFYRLEAGTYHETNKHLLLK